VQSILGAIRICYCVFRCKRMMAFGMMYIRLLTTTLLHQIHWLPVHYRIQEKAVSDDARCSCLAMPEVPIQTGLSNSPPVYHHVRDCAGPPSPICVTGSLRCCHDAEETRRVRVLCRMSNCVELTAGWDSSRFVKIPIPQYSSDNSSLAIIAYPCFYF